MIARTTHARLPEDQHQTLVDQLDRLRRGCPHVADTSIVIGCVQHLETLRCADCADRHTATHTHAEEHLCDVCNGPLDGDDGDTWHLNMLAPVILDRSVSLGRGRTARVHAVTLIGWGSCWSCHVDAEWNRGAA